MKTVLIAACAVVLSIFWACHLDPADSKVTLDVSGDSTWLGFEWVEIRVQDTASQGAADSEILFRGRIQSLDELRSLPAGSYAGGTARFIIRGYRNDSLILEEIRHFNGSTGKAIAETTLAVDGAISSFLAIPESLVLYTGGESRNLAVQIKPAYARPALEWELEGDAAVMQGQGYSERAFSPKRNGQAFIRVRTGNPGAPSLRIPIRVIEDAPKLSASPAKLFIAPGSEVEFAVKSRQEYGNLVRYEWDLDGDGAWDDSSAGPWTGKEVDLPVISHRYAIAGKFIVRFRVRDSEGNFASAQSVVDVGERKPAVDLRPKDTVISIRDEVRFSADIQEPGGRLEGYTWDWNGDGKPDDVATLADSAVSLSVKRTFSDSGEHRIILRARDAEGKAGADTSIVRVILDPPRVDPGSPVTSKTGVAVSFRGSAFDSLGTIVMYRWDFQGDGTDDDSSATPPDFTHAFAREGEYSSRLTVRDDDGNLVSANRLVKISDVPFVITAKRSDTTISIKDRIPMTASIRNEDGKALTYSWDFDGDGRYDDTASGNQTSISVTKTSLYAHPGRFKATFRVVDSQGKALVDTVLITVLLDPPKADLGNDFTALTGEKVPIRLAEKANQFGAITRRELRINDTVWIPLSSADTNLTMPASKGIVRIIGRVTDEDDLTDLDTLDITVNHPTENRLSGIFLSSGVLSPAFHADSLAYAVSYGYGTTAAVLGALPRDPNATVSVNGTTLGGSTTTVSVPLVTGANVVRIVVKAQDTASKRTYTVTITRAPTPISSLSALAPGLVAASDTLKPRFAPGTFAYTLNVSDHVDSLRFTPTVTDPSARVTVNGVATASGTASQKLPVAIGSQKYDIVVTAESGARSTYAVTVVRSGWSLVGTRAFASSRTGVTSLVAGDGQAYVAFLENATVPRPHVWKWDNAAWTDIVRGSIRDSANTPPTLGLIGGVPWLASHVYYNGPGYYINIRKHVSGNSWTAVGRPVSGGYSVYELSLDQDRSSRPFMAYRHAYIKTKSMLHRLADTVWTLQPDSGNVDTTANLRMAVHPLTGYPALASTRGGAATTLHSAVILSHNGASHSPLGSNAGWPVANARIDFAFDSLGAAYYAYVNPTTQLAAVRKFSGTWSPLGSASGFSEGEASSISLAVIGNRPVVAYRDAKRSTVVVKIWNGTDWIDFGAADFEVGDAGSVRLAVDNTGVWVAFGATGTSPGISVMRRPLP